MDAFLTDDGLMLLFSSGGPLEPADLYVAVRTSLNEPFSASAPLDDLNTAAEERDPWLTRTAASSSSCPTAGDS